MVGRQVQARLQSHEWQARARAWQDRAKRVHAWDRCKGEIRYKTKEFQVVRSNLRDCSNVGILMFEPEIKCHGFRKGPTCEPVALGGLCNALQKEKGGGWEGADPPLPWKYGWSLFLSPPRDQWALKAFFGSAWKPPNASGWSYLHGKADIRLPGRGNSKTSKKVVALDSVVIPSGGHT